MEEENEDSILLLHTDYSQHWWEYDSEVNDVEDNEDGIVLSKNSDLVLRYTVTANIAKPMSRVANPPIPVKVFMMHNISYVNYVWNKNPCL